MLKIEKTNTEIRIWWENERMENHHNLISSDIIKLLQQHTKVKVTDDTVIRNIVGINDIRDMKNSVINDLKIIEALLTDKYLSEKYPSYIIKEIEVEKIKQVKSSIGTYTGINDEFSGGLYTQIDIENGPIYYRIKDNLYVPCMIKGDTLIISCINSTVDDDDMVEITNSKANFESFKSVDDLIIDLRKDDIK